MKKMKIFISTMLIFSSINAFSVKAAESSSVDATSQTIGQLSPKEQALTNEKLKLSEDYYNNKKNNKTINGMVPMTYNSSKVMYYPYNKQEAGNWCGPAAAYNAITGYKPSLVGVATQYSLSRDLGTGAPGGNGTPIPGSWSYIMNSYLGGNNYAVIMGSSYNATDWRAKVKNCVIYTVDKGYPVIVDTKQDPYGIKLYPKYSYIDDRGVNGASTFHYITVTGYDDTPGNDRIFYSDSHPDFNERYWTYTTNVATVSNPMGIIW
ncbi:C39 family peptidase [Clostridium sp. C8-1-8]|uniref:C39 family peptidase n=1 Tax=Clostridium sp. C8-1-8 TaxID=2698831 RepID=UPI001FABBB50|nr:C39 family peptidase [Clostridium sp. C8-1-8]